MSLVRRPGHLAAAIVLCGLLGLSAAGPLAATEKAGGRVVAIGDIHGAYEGLLSILQASGLTDEEGSWVGGQATLVQVGDFMGRGSGVRQVMDLLIELEAAAADAGGRVVVLLGNHEVMSLMGDLRYATPEIYASFETAASERRGEEAWEQWVALLRTQSGWRTESFTVPAEESKRDFLAARPSGYFEYIDALGPEGKYGRWLRSLPSVAQVGDTLFVHGGISPEMSSLSVEEINEAVSRELREFDGIRQRLVDFGVLLPFLTFAEMRDAISLAIEVLERNPRRLRSGGRVPFLREAIRDFFGMRDWLSFSSDGPLWFRGYARWDEKEGRDESARLVDAYGVARIVVGHTPPNPPSDIQPRFGGRIYLIDTGMLAGHYPGGRPSALEITDERITAMYEDERVVLWRGDYEPVPASTVTGNAEALRRAVSAGAGHRGMQGGYALAAMSSQPEAREVELDLPPREAAERWIGPDDEVLPFETDEELLELLRDGEILSIEDIPVGVTDPKKLLLEKDGVRAHAIFRYEHEVALRRRLADGTFLMFFKDSHTGEPAAYEMDRLLGLGTVPPAVPRRLRRLGDGSIQLWIENAMTEHQRRTRQIEPPDRVRFIRQLHNMNVFDNLVNNTDRNLGNILIGPDWKIWYIDCTRCFARDRNLPKPERVRQIERGFWERLQALDHDLVRERLAPYLSRHELRALLERHEKVVRRIRDRIDELGEDAVLFAFEAPPTPEFEALEMPEFPPATEPPILEPEEGLREAPPGSSLRL